MKGEQNSGTHDKQGNSGDEGLEHIGKVSHQQVKRSTTEHPLEGISRIPISCNSSYVSPNKSEGAGKAVAVDPKSNANVMTSSSTEPANSLPRPDSN